MMLRQGHFPYIVCEASKTVYAVFEDILYVGTYQEKGLPWNDLVRMQVVEESYADEVKAVLDFFGKSRLYDKLTRRN